jgi:NAD(P)-dependent dehydrogenase (short-subunit alcohol dehydrogenase family)
VNFAGSGVGVSMLAPGWVLTDSVRAFMKSSPEAAAAVAAYRQEPDVVAKAAWDGLLGGRYIIATNPKSVPFATEHAEAVLAELRAVAARA